MNEKAKWLRPKTIRRYLHPAGSERIFTLWVEGKIVFGDVNIKDFKLGSGYKEGRKYYFDLESSIIQLLYSKASEQFDFKNVKNIISEDGTPIHGLSYEIDNQIISIEALCNDVRKSTCFIKITLKNITDKKIKDTVSLLMRSGKESELVYGTPNGYVRHEPDVKVLKKMPSTYRNINDLNVVNKDESSNYDDENSEIGTDKEEISLVKETNDTYTDGERYLNVKTNIYNHFDSNNGILYFDYELDANEEKNIYLSFDKGEISDFDYEEEKKKNQDYWHNELSSLNLPNELVEDKDRYKMIRHLVACLLQTFAYPNSEDYMISRQGGMMSICWPSEALFTIEALSKIGNFGKYIEKVLDTHFFVMQKESGEVGNVGAHWGSVTASVIYSFCKYAQSVNNKDIYNRYIKQALKAYRWIVDTRKEVKDSEKVAGGLFPPQNSNDWEACMQGWTLTDVFNIFALNELSKTAKQYGDDIATEIKFEHDEYVKDMKRHFKKFLDRYKDLDELKIPLLPISDDQFLIDDGFPLIYHGRFILSGVIDKKEDIYRVYRYMLNHGICKDGLYGYMPYPNGNRHIWYMSFPDFYWHIIWTKLNEKDLAKQIIDNQINYAMTNEYYMLERYEDNCPYYVPWSPNASANARLILMMLGEINGYEGEYE